MMSTASHTAKRPGRSYIIRYSLLFLGISFFVFLPFLLCGRSFVNKVDGMPQYVVYLRYMGQYLRRCAGNMLHGEFSLPLYDFSIGLGDDIGQIVRFHPLDFLSAFVPSRYTEYLYAFILLLRFYLSGLAFSLYAFYWNSVPAADGQETGERVSPTNVLSGSLVYVFCGFMLIRVMNHPIYAAPFIVLPLLLLGAEKVMRHQGCALFVFSVFLGFWSNYYFMYIMSFALFVYMLVRYAEAVRPLGIKSFLTLFVKMVSLYLLGLAMSMMTLLPTMYRYLASARQQQTSETFNMLIYADKRRYAAWFLNLISPYQSSGNGTDLNFAVIALPCLAVLFTCGWKRFRSLKKFLIMDLIMLLVPFFGYVLAVFNNENNRWMFLIAICLGMTVVFTADSFAHLSRRQMTAVAGLAVVFAAATVLQTVIGELNVYNLAAAAELILCTGILIFCTRRRAGTAAVRRVVLGITCVSTVINGCMTYAPGFGAVALDYVEAGKTMSRYDHFWRSQGARVIEDDSFYRVDGYDVKHGRENSAEYSDYNGTSEYNSILNANLLETMIDQNNPDLDAITILKGLNARPVSMNLAHVRYYIARQKDAGSVPYGYRAEPVAQKGKVSVYENEYPLAFGWSCDAFITREDYDALEPLEKEMVQLEAVVLPEEEEGGAALADTLRAAGLTQKTESSCAPVHSDVQIPAQGSGYSYADGILTAGKQAVVSVEYEKREGYDVYLQLNGLRIDGQTALLKVEGENFSGRALIRGSRQVYNIGREDYLFHLGYADADGPGVVNLQFKPGTYQLSSAEAVYVPMEGYEEKIAALNEEPLLQEQIEDGRVTGQVSFSSPKMMVFSVPAAGGWTLKVDGEKTDLCTADQMYLGVFLPEGDHQIELTYRTPGLQMGIWIAVPALALWILMALYESKKRRERRSGRGNGSVAEAC